MSGAVVLDWNTVTGATGYNVYYDNSSNVNTGTASVVAAVSPPFSVTGLVNGATYFFVVTATNAGGEGSKSTEVSSAPEAASLGTQPTAQEILMLELVNRARFNPTAEATGFGIGLNDGLAGGTISTAQKPPLAFNIKLMNSSRSHSAAMTAVDDFNHNIMVGGVLSTPWTRIAAAGYTYSNAAENISAQGTSAPTINITTAIPQHHQGLFESAGHRVNILNGSLRELGIGQATGNLTYGASGVFFSSLITQNFGTPIGSPNFLTGVIYSDNNSSYANTPGDIEIGYDVSEGISGITILIDGVGYPVFSTGAYSIPLINGTYDVAIAGAGLPSIVQTSVTFSGVNKKLDIRIDGGNVNIDTW